MFSSCVRHSPLGRDLLQLDDGAGLAVVPDADNVLKLLVSGEAHLEITRLHLQLGLGHESDLVEVRHAHVEVALVLFPFDMVKPGDVVFDRSLRVRAGNGSGTGPGAE